jgi:hypothetical protein
MKRGGPWRIKMVVSGRPDEATGICAEEEESDTGVSPTTEAAKRWLERVSPFIEKAPRTEPRCAADIAQIRRDEDTGPRLEGSEKYIAHMKQIEGLGILETPEMPEECDAGRFLSNEYASRWRGKNKTQYQKMRAERRSEHRAKAKAKAKANKGSVDPQDVQAVRDAEQEAARDSIMCIFLFVGVSLLIPLLVFASYRVAM